MGWYHGMTPEEIEKEFGDGNAPSCSISQSKKHSTKAAPTTEDEKPSASTKGNTACPLPPSSPPPPPPPDVDYIYHLCQQSKWEEALQSRQPYFPPTYMKDGKFTRASVYKEDIVSVANEYYKTTPGKWIVLEINCKLLYSLGIPILAQEAPESTPKQPVKCLQVYGGISTTLPGLINKVYPMLRKNSEGTFVKLLEATYNTNASHQATAGDTSKPLADAPEQPKESTTITTKDDGKKKKGLFGRLKKG
jgi:hypothetical protein